MVVFAVDDRLERADGVFDLDELAGDAGEDFRDVERLAKEALDLARAATTSLSSSESSSMPRMAMMSWRLLYFWSVSWTARATS